MLRALVVANKAPGVAPGQRFRIEQWEPHLRDRHGITLEYAAFESPALTRVLYESGKVAEKAFLLLRDALRRRSVVESARRHDVVVLYREAALIGPPLYEWLIARTRVPIVFDFDDAIWTAPRRTAVSANDAFRALKFSGKTAKICELATVVTVGNQYLAAWARTHNERVHVVPTSIDLAAYPVQPALAASEPFTVVWSGTFSTLAHLETARAALEGLARRRPVRLHVICDRPFEPPIAGVETHFIPWKAADEARAIGTAHVGIMPMPDDEFARGKCGCKALQYMAAGRPAVVSPVGVNTDIVRHRENGLLARSTEEWIDALDELASSEALRDRIAAAGRATVEAGYSSTASASRFARAVHEALGGGHRVDLSPPAVQPGGTP
jgi:glycosyltransferase involved in cell wall biosynthesis